jgi:hypothetical protein
MQSPAQSLVPLTVPTSLQPRIGGLAATLGCGSEQMHSLRTKKQLIRQAPSSSFPFRLQRDLDQAADGIRLIRHVILLAALVVQLLQRSSSDSEVSANKKQ